MLFHFLNDLQTFWIQFFMTDISKNIFLLLFSINLHKKQNKMLVLVQEDGFDIFFLSKKYLIVLSFLK